jgi:hypothetical protein
MTKYQADNDNITAEAMNAIYKAFNRDKTGKDIRREKYLRSVLRIRYTDQVGITGAIHPDDIPLELFSEDFGGFISTMQLEYHIANSGYDFDRDGPMIFEFEDRGDDIFTKGTIIQCVTIPDDEDEDGWSHVLMHEAVSVFGVYEEEIRNAA